jgi:hypothetical protein
MERVYAKKLSISSHNHIPTINHLKIILVECLWHSIWPFTLLFANIPWPINNQSKEMQNTDYYG